MKTGEFKGVVVGFHLRKRETLAEEGNISRGGKRIIIVPHFHRGEFPCIFCGKQ